ncbi:response regulator transcription factor [Ancylobacter sp. 6x-1]|uniref:Response regulator transcription factor n=1 Tax=Ancylobacter crimeensis TaxID=2579147 RepID=A0ABT0DBC4_9HYPH|nr:response regulator transcription factor [Ancylobacter crimeensis]MCK0197260.1 response regulator transcription factor [Ancylobacter crimeensis]
MWSMRIPGGYESMESANFDVTIDRVSRYIDVAPRNSGANSELKALKANNIPVAGQADACIALIEPRRLLGQCLSIALRSVDQANALRVYGSVAEWRQSSDASTTALVIISAPDLSEDLTASFDVKKELADLKACKPPVKFAILSDRESPKHVMNAIQSGAQGYIPTSISIEVIAQILQLMKFGGTFVPATSLMAMADNPAAPQMRPTDDNSIFTSQRQLMVARALRKGAPNKVIAYQLNMCESTVKVHVRNIMKKLKAKNRTEVALLTANMFPDDTGN